VSQESYKSKEYLRGRNQFDNNVANQNTYILMKQAQEVGDGMASNNAANRNVGDVFSVCDIMSDCRIIVDTGSSGIGIPGI